MWVLTEKKKKKNPSREGFYLFGGKKMACFMNVSLGVPRHPYFLMSHGGRDGGYAWVQKHELLLTKTDLAIAAAKCPIPQQKRSTLSS